MINGDNGSFFRITGALVHPYQIGPFDSSDGMTKIPFSTSFFLSSNTIEHLVWLFFHPYQIGPFDSLDRMIKIPFSTFFFLVQIPLST